MMSQIKYSRVSSGDCTPTRDSVAIDFSSAFNYKSAFTYSKMVPPYLNEEKVYKPPVVTRICTLLVIGLSYVLLVLTFPLSGFLAIKTVQQFERIVVFRLGRLQPPKGPGVILVIPVIDRWKRIDMRTRAFNVPPQQILTADGGAISVGATVYHRITDVALSVAGVQDLDHSIRTLGQTDLLKLLSSQDLSAIDRDKGLINAHLQEDMNTVTQNWGVEVSRVEISAVTVIQEPAPPGVNFQKMTNMFTHIAGHMTSGVASKQQPSGLSALLSMAAASPAPSQHRPTPNPRMTSPPQVPTTSTLVELSTPSSLTPDQILAMALPVLDEELVRQVGAVFKFVITGDSGGTFYLDLLTGKGSAGAGEPPNPANVTLTMTAGDLQAMFSGELRPYSAYMSGRLQVDGDRNTALALENVIAKMREQSIV